MRLSQSGPAGHARSASRKSYLPAKIRGQSAQFIGMGQLLSEKCDFYGERLKKVPSVVYTRGGTLWQWAVSRLRLVLQSR